MTTCIHAFFAAWGNPSPETRAENVDADIGPNFDFSDFNAPTPVHFAGPVFADLTDRRLTRVIGTQAWESPIDRPRH